MGPTQFFSARVNQNSIYSARQTSVCFIAPRHAPEICYNRQRYEYAMEMRPHPVFEGYYVTPTGRVYSNRSGKLREKKPTIRRKNGYYTMSIQTAPGKTYGAYYLHHLIAETYLGARPEGLVINHIDGDKRNNNAENLEYVTQNYNVFHGRRNHKKYNHPPYEVDAPPLHTNYWWK